MVLADLFARRLQEQRPSLGCQKVHKQVLITFSKNGEGCRDGSAKNHMN